MTIRLLLLKNAFDHGSRCRWYVCFLSLFLFHLLRLGSLGFCLFLRKKSYTKMVSVGVCLVRFGRMVFWTYANRFEIGLIC